MRIISGKWKGKKLDSPLNNDIRPTSDRTREALFNLLIHLDDFSFIDQPVMDICCGSGALGLEALSRGASHCTFIDNANAALKLTQRNIDVLGARGISKVVQASASQLPTAANPVALIMIDPPYKHLSLVEHCYEALQAKGWLMAGTIISIEHHPKDTAPELAGCEIFKQRKYGKSEITLYRVEN